TSVSRLPLMTAEERARVFTRFNQTSGPFPDEPAWACFERRVRERPDAEAVVCRDARLTYRELNAAANRVAHFLLAAGVRPGGLVAVSVERGVELPAALLGIWKTGAAFVPLDSRDPRQRIEQTLADCGAGWLLTEDATVWEGLPLPVI